MIAVTIQDTRRNLQRNFNADGTITVYLNHHKQFRGTPAQAQNFIKRWYGKNPVTLCKDTYTYVDATKV